MSLAEPSNDVDVPSQARRRHSVDLATTAPGTPGGIFMRQFWHAIGLSAELPAGRSRPLRIMSEDYTLYRGQSGTVHITQFRCPHRGAPLHLGWIEEDSIRCVYHGWKFADTGQCVEMPAEEPGYEKKVRIRTYPAAEAFGLIYGFFGEGAPPAFPPYPESQGEGVIDPWPIDHVPCNYLQAFENTMDEVHVAFTHQPGGSHAKLAQDLPIITAEETDWGMMRYGRRADGKLRHTIHYAPNIVRVIVPPMTGMDGVGGWPEITFHSTPVDDENHIWVTTSKVRVTGAEADRYWQKRAEFHQARAEAPGIISLVHRIWAGEVRYCEAHHPELALVQDIAVQAGQGRIQNREEEFLGRSDAAIILWRRILTRELRAIAEGRPPKQWKRAGPEVVPELGV